MENTNSWKSQIQKNTNFEKSYNLYADKNDLRKIEVIKDYKNQALGNCPANCPAPKLTRINFMPATGLSLLFWIPAELLPEQVLSMFITTPSVAASGATNFRIMFSTYVLQGSFLIAVTLFQSLGKANKATWLVLFRQIILFIPLCVLLPMIGGLGIRGVWLAIALTDAVLVVITIAMMASEFRKMPPTSQTLR